MMPSFRNFISFEGIDFSGKSTQIDLLVKKLQAMNWPVEVVREPGGTSISEQIRNILLDAANQDMVPQTEILLYSAARAQLVHQKILPALQEGKYLIADRFYDSTTAYQGYGRGLDIEFVKQLNQFATSRLTPYRTFLLDIPVEVAESRQKKAGIPQDRLEQTGKDFYQRVREGFLTLARQEPERFIIIDADRPVQAIFDDIWREVQKFWKINKR